MATPYYIPNLVINIRDKNIFNILGNINLDDTYININNTVYPYIIWFKK